MIEIAAGIILAVVILANWELALALAGICIFLGIIALCFVFEPALGWVVVAFFVFMLANDWWERYKRRPPAQRAYLTTPEQVWAQWAKRMRPLKTISAPAKAPTVAPGPPTADEVYEAQRRWSAHSRAWDEAKAKRPPDGFLEG